MAIVTIDRQWKPMRIGKRNDVAGIWDFDELSEFLPQQPQSNGQVALPPVQTNSIPSEIAKLASGIVRVKYWLPDPADDYGAQTGGAFGLVVDAEQGLVLVSRDLIPHDRCQIVLTFGGSLKVKGTIKASHPVLSAVLVQYDASVVGNAAVAVRFSSEDIAQGDKGYFFKMDSEWNSRFKEVHVTRKETTRSSHRDMMVDYVKVDYDHVKWGVLAKSDGSITAQWTLYAREKHGMLSRQLVPILDSMLKEDRSTFSSLDVQLEVVTLEQAGDLGVPTGKRGTIHRMSELTQSRIHRAS